MTVTIQQKAQLMQPPRGISLLSIAGKILARILLNRLTHHLKSDHLPESQCGFRKNRGTLDMIFAARQLQEKCREQQSCLYSTYVDLTKAFDTVSRDGLWRIMAKFGCPPRFISMVRQFHVGMQARVRDNGAVSESFTVTNGVKQRYVLVPTLFSIMYWSCWIKVLHLILSTKTSSCSDFNPPMVSQEVPMHG